MGSLGDGAWQEVDKAPSDTRMDTVSSLVAQPQRPLATTEEADTQRMFGLAST